MKVAVVGAGIMGLSAAWALSRRGHDVAIYEQGPIPNPRGSSVDQHRLIRHAYGAQAGYVRMVSEAYRAWEEVWGDLGDVLYVPTGTLVLGTTREGWVEGSARALEGFGFTVLWLERAELERRYPLLSAEGAARAFHVATGGVLLAGRIVEELARHCAARGVALHAETRVAEVDPVRGRLFLESGPSVEADTIVIAAGAWAARLVPALTGRLTPSRQVVVYLDPPPERASAWAVSPMILDIARDAGLYVVPPVRGTGLKIGDHRFSLAGDPDAPRETGDEEVRAILELCRPRLRDFNRYRVVRANVCFYAVTPHERFVVEALGRALLLSACSGHGFKFGPVIGLAVAETIEGRRDPATLARWAAGEN